MSDSLPVQQPDTLETQVACDRWFDLYVSGPKITRWKDLPIQVGDLAPSITLVDGRTSDLKALEEYWQEQTTLILFWRHFGCSCGRDRAKRLIEEMPRFRELNVKVVIIAQGEPDRARVYIKANEIPDDVRILLDKDESAYRKYGILDCGALEVLFDAPDEFLRREEAAARSFVEARKAVGIPPVDNPWLLPAEFVVKPGGELVFIYRHQHCENYLDPRVLVAAIRTANGEFERY